MPTIVSAVAVAVVLAAEASAVGSAAGRRDCLLRLYMMGHICQSLGAWKDRWKREKGEGEGVEWSGLWSG